MLQTEKALKVGGLICVEKGAYQDNGYYTVTAYHRGTDRLLHVVYEGDPSRLRYRFLVRLDIPSADRSGMPLEDSVVGHFLNDVMPSGWEDCGSRDRVLLASWEPGYNSGRMRELGMRVPNLAVVRTQYNIGRILRALYITAEGEVFEMSAGRIWPDSTRRRVDKSLRRYMRRLDGLDGPIRDETPRLVIFEQGGILERIQDLLASREEGMLRLARHL
ncbi:hypothetical protein J4419_02530 [Candidatus Woesearchaeota archaeon]|nr:hypothetical protein [Candidatus Woesearchaeota archaeon]